jgi:hypothetical protein
MSGISNARERPPRTRGSRTASEVPRPQEG